MKDVQITKFCDMCFDADGSKNLADHEVVATVVIDNSRRPVFLQLDVCEVHTKELDKLAAVIARLGVPLVGKNAQSVMPPIQERAVIGPQTPCPICDRELTRSGLTNHIWSQHLRLERPSLPTQCPDCDYNNSTTAVGRHRSQMHLYDPVAEAVAFYEDRESKAKPKARKSTAKTPA